MKKLLALALTLALTLSAAPALAADREMFPAVNTYPGFPDVVAGSWYEAEVKTCYETGLMLGNGIGFAPDKTMQIAEVAAIATRIGEIFTGKAAPLADPKVGETLPWYVSAVAYMDALAAAHKSDILVSRLAAPTEMATRGDFIGLLALVLPETALTPQNSIVTLPDSKDPQVLAFYNAGILQGIGKYGHFEGDKTLTRCEAAAMLTRVARPAQRKTFTLPDYSLFAAADCRPDTVFFANGATAETYLTAALARIDALEARCLQEGIPFNWFHTLGDKTFLEEVKAAGLTAAQATEKEGSAAFRGFDLQVFYSKMVDLRGEAGK